MGIGGLADSMSNISEYFSNIHRFVSPISEYHQFYLYWWFAWSIMIGQFVARFVGGMQVWKLLLALIVVPSIPIAIWLSVLYFYFSNGIETAGLLNAAMIIVGITFVINSLDSLIRLYSDNLKLTPARLGKPVYIIGNIAVLFGLTLAFQSQWLQIQWIGAIVVGIYLACVVFIFLTKRSDVMAIESSPPENTLDYDKIESVH